MRPEIHLKMKMLEELKKLVAEQLWIEEQEIKLESSFVEDLGADSLDLVELIIAVEEKFELQIPDSDAEKLITVQNVLDYLFLKGRGVLES